MEPVGADHESKKWMGAGFRLGSSLVCIRICEVVGGSLFCDRVRGKRINGKLPVGEAAFFFASYAASDCLNNFEL